MIRNPTDNIDHAIIKGNLGRKTNIMMFILRERMAAGDLSHKT